VATALLAVAVLALLAPATVPAAGTAIGVRSSEYGRILFGPNRQAIYVFQRDRRNRSRCYGECARDWPPVDTEGKPRAPRGARSSLLGTIRRRDGRLQVT
jgi:predicted lipoprotein with Yx(FWY)xxD motif